MEDKQITYLGKVDHHNKMTKFGIRARDREKHMYIIGKTGTGKSTFLENMIVQDIQNGNGLAFIDPHGSSAEKILDYIPEWRMNDVVYFNPSDMEFPVAFNPMEDIGPDKRHLVADGLMSVFEKIWPEAFSGRATYILNNTMLALLEYPEPTVLSINRMLIDKDFRKKVIANVTDATVRNAWEELQKWDDKRWSEAVGTLINKVGQFTTNPIIRNIIGQSKSTFDFRKAMDERKIIIINLSKGMIGEQNAPLIGAMIITKIYLAAMSRAELPGRVISQMAPFYFYVDEFQNFANDSFANILSEARKYKLALTVANQYIAQMEETIRDAVFGNMGSTIAFRVGPLDAEFMEKVFAPVFTQDDLQNIIFRQFYITLQIDGMGSKPFSAQSLDMIMPLEHSLRDQVIDASRRQFARPRVEVNQTIIDWFGYNKKTETPAMRSDVGTAKAPMGKLMYDTGNSSQSNRPIYQSQPSANQNRMPQQAQSKSLPPITGYRNDVKAAPRFDVKSESKMTPVTNQLPIAKPVGQVAAVQEPAKALVKPIAKPVVTSDTLKDLLGKLDEVSADSSPVKDSKSQTLQVASVPTWGRNETLMKDQGVGSDLDTEQKPKVFAPTNSKLSRAASPEKKSALAEALAKAMRQVPETTSEKSEVPSVSHMIIPEVPKIEVVPEPTIKHMDQNVAPESSVVPDIPIPKAPVANQVFTQSKTPREVPEDILRKVLE